jgi:hypothetical protein
MSEAVLSARYMDHYFYFAKRADADEAARRLRGRNWTNRAGSRGADQKNWLVLAPDSQGQSRNSSICTLN